VFAVANVGLSELSLAVTLAGCAFILAIGIAFLRSSHIAVIADPETVTVRNFWRTTTIPVADITALRAGDIDTAWVPTLPTGRRGILVDSTDGTVGIEATLVSRWRPSTPGLLQQEMVQLRAAIGRAV
jgi:Bacterial PH domain